MRRALILCLFLSLGQVSGNCATTFFPPLLPTNAQAVNNFNNDIVTQADPYLAQQKQNFPNISNIEQTIFGQTYTNQNIATRLSRIEKSLFTTTYPNSSNSQRTDNIISNFNQINKQPNISINDLSKLEAKVFNQTYVKNSLEQRLERLEQELLGAVQSGDVEARYNLLKSASRNYNPVNDYPTDVSTRGGGWKALTRGIGSAMLGGTMTGFTPPIGSGMYNGMNSGFNGYNNYNTTSNMFNNPYNTSAMSAYPSGYGMYRGNRSNRGYSDSFQNFSSGTGVTILD